MTTPSALRTVALRHIYLIKLIQDHNRRHWHRPYARETNDTSDFVCKTFGGADDDGIVPLVEIEEEDDGQGDEPQGLP